ncbi:hypothetical protein C1646_777853 [Rhizophagus diaphanus]|nr:hypothetical protein C1646_777853 [Rhizophagus diaphanus] [Rhizophagus sp. MUCL 43196]
MIPNNQNTQDYYNLSTDQTGNSAPQQILNNNNTLHINTYNTTFEFYFYLPNDTRIYRVTYSYSELNPSENVQLLNNLSRIPYHYGVQSQIQQQIQQQIQHPIVYHQNGIQQQPFDTTHPTSQVYNTAANGTVLQDMGDTGFQNSH